jgi:hypothetical protein
LFFTRYTWQALIAWHLFQAEHLLPHMLLQLAGAELPLAAAALLLIKPSTGSAAHKSVKTVFADILDMSCSGQPAAAAAAAEVMSDLLAFEADRRALNITLNSIGTELTRDDR